MAIYRVRFNKKTLTILFFALTLTYLLFTYTSESSSTNHPTTLNSQLDSNKAQVPSTHQPLYDSANNDGNADSSHENSNPGSKPLKNSPDPVDIGNAQDQLDNEQQGKKLRERQKPVINTNRKPNAFPKGVPKNVPNGISNDPSKNKPVIADKPLNPPSNPFASFRKTLLQLHNKFPLAPPPPPEVQKASHLVIVPGHAIFMPRPALKAPDTSFEDDPHMNDRQQQRPPAMEMPRDTPADMPNLLKKRAVLPQDSVDPILEAADSRLAKDSAGSESKLIQNKPAKQLGKQDTNNRNIINQDSDTEMDIDPPVSKNKVSDNLNQRTDTSANLVPQNKNQNTKTQDTKALSGKLQDTVDDDSDLIKIKGDGPSIYTAPSSSRSEYYKNRLNIFSNTLTALDPRDEANWMLASFQKSQTETFLKHIRVAAKIARKDPNAVLVFSGGQTQQFAGPYSEAQSYWSLAASVLNEYDVPDLSVSHEDSADTSKHDIRQHDTSASLVNRMLAEEYAADSYENLLFSIARFREYTGKYPDRITVVGLAFKQERFENVHRTALRFPAQKFRYVGIDPPELKTSPASTHNRDAVTENEPDANTFKKSPRYIQALLGERKNALEPFIRDPHGCKEPSLVEKKRERNPFRRSHPYLLSCPELLNLFTVCSNELSTEEVYKDLPWIN